MHLIELVFPIDAVSAATVRKVLRQQEVKFLRRRGECLRLPSRPLVTAGAVCPRAILPGRFGECDPAAALFDLEKTMIPANGRYTLGRYSRVNAKSARARLCIGPCE